MKKKKNAIITMATIGIVLVIIFSFKGIEDKNPVNTAAISGISEENNECVACHEKSGNGRAIIEQWKESKHGKNGVGCLECHAADKTDKDAFEHHGQTIATVVTPKDCSTCHKNEVNEFTKSHHADAGMIMGSLDNVLAEVVEGHAGFNDGANPAASNGCWQCHGSKIEVLKDENGKTKLDENGILMYDPKTWPNTGIGRVNLDGSKGSCSACHTRHSFSSEQARQPENCGKCHLGPDHPQMEIYNESKHGINYRAYREKMNLGSDKWIVGEDYFAAPTCATCHMSATPNQPITHDVGNRISWTLRPPVSQKVDAAQLKKYEKENKQVPEGFLGWEKRRDKMQNVCQQCHAINFVENFYSQYDNEVNLYNNKFGIPATDIYKLLKSSKILTTINFDEKIEWTYFYLWHHEGRRARMGASMMAPDYTQWHGNFEVADRFYNDFIPEVQELIEKAKANGKKEEAEEVEKLVNKTLNSELHKWYIGKMDPEEIKKRKEASKAFRERYAN